jgi:hypothetical protein
VNHEVKIIVVYRNFNDFARSRHAKYGWDMERLRREYVNAYSTALLQLSIWGGVVISYDDVLDMSEDAWAQSIQTLTGLSSTNLVNNRNHISGRPTMKRDDSSVIHFDDVDTVQEKLRLLTNVVL